MRTLDSLITLKQKMTRGFYAILSMTLIIGFVAIALSQSLKFKVEQLVNEDIAKITVALNLAKQAQRLQVIASQLEQMNDEKSVQDDLTSLGLQWQELITTSRTLSNKKISILKRQQLEKHIDKEIHFSQQAQLIAKLTNQAIQDRHQALNVQTNLVLLQQSFANSLHHLLIDLDARSLTLLKTRSLKLLEQNQLEHQQIGHFLHMGERLFALLLQVSNNKTIPEINTLQRAAMRISISMTAALNQQIVLQALPENWLSQISQNMVGANNIFQLTRNASKSDRIAKAHLHHQAIAAQNISRYTQDLVSEVEQSIQNAQKDLISASSAFLILVCCAGVIYSFFIWLANWHFISKGIIKPVIATSHAMQAIANEETDTPLPKTDSVELHQMYDSLATLKSYAIQVKAISDRDGLTGIYNRRYFDYQLAKQLVQMKAHQRPLAIILLDIDKFKQYNDKYGHVAGDNCLKSVIRSINAQLERPTDMLARYGGDEFVVLLPDTGLTQAADIAERMRLSINQLAIKHSESDYNQTVTISLGISCCMAEQDIEASTLVHQADEALYQAKAEGRNRANIFSFLT